MDGKNKTITYWLCTNLGWHWSETKQKLFTLKHDLEAHKIPVYVTEERITYTQDERFVGISRRSL